ncbi:ABC transporter cytochrome c/heme export CcmA [Acetobacter orientalis]|uniref:ABC transporter cytochrome c/heme export CcmA n=1 Tax=Acetobacter orientalis TaxID=146474 RepID=A0A2Z5ZID3_9PROT|nr:ABC transporter cytochrome c/heme export CcmA [Acetobacter orientalis]GAN65335.1 ABC transporter cytochrome c/heme export CcmA [Acetobacter orientalis]GEL62212.1 cytochrome c biogenesis ATP-binding export protein CcmA [Acetobacter orientalis]
MFTPEQGEDGPAPLSSAPPCTALLAAESLRVFRGDRLVLNEISLTLCAGEAMLLTGPNGAGKSTLLRVLAGLRRPDAGALLWCGTPIAEDTAAHASRVAYLGHQDALKPSLSVRENLSLFLTPTGPTLTQALSAVDLLDLADLPARLLSAGQKRRAALARVLLANAPLWLLDEPSLGLDANAITLLGHAITQHRAQGGMVIATTHVPLPLEAVRHLALPATPEHLAPLWDDLADDTWPDQTGATA